MKRRLLFSSALTFVSALAGDENDQQLDRGGKLKPMLPFSEKQLPLQRTRDLRAIMKRRGGGKSSKPDLSPPDDQSDHDDRDGHKDHGGHKEDDDDDDYHTEDDGRHHDDDGKHPGKSGKKGGKGGKGEKGGKGGKGPSSKSGKSSKGEHHDHTTYYMAPFPCTNKCIDADGANFNTGELNEAVQSCNTHEKYGETQEWIVHAEDDLVQVESYAYKGKCIAVDYMPGDKPNAVKGSCRKGTLVLLPCRDPSSYWYFTGGQLLSFFCWSRGVSAAMSVSLDAEEEMCHKELTAYDARSGMKRNHEDKIRGETFMFITKDAMHQMYDPIDGGSEVPTFFPSYFPTLSPLSTISDLPTPNPTLAPTYTPTNEP